MKNKIRNSTAAYVHVRWMINSARKPAEKTVTKGLSQITVCYTAHT